MPLMQAFFPWPDTGRFVSTLCLGLSAASFFLLFSLPSATQSAESSPGWRIYFALSVFPWAVYISYFSSRIRRQSDGYWYFSAEATHSEWSLPLLISFLVCIIFWFLK